MKRQEGDGNVIRVGMGQMRVAGSPAVMTALGIGSCVVVMLWDGRSAAGGMAHIMLPQRPKRTPANLNPFKYADYAIARMVETLEAAGCRRRDMGAKIVGGAHMFMQGRGNSPLDIGKRNVKAVRRCLEEIGLPVLAEDTGGAHGRSVDLYLSDGQVRVRALRAGEITL